jgi:hypothetical protein
MAKLRGLYHKSNSNLFNESRGIHLVLSSRKKTTSKKPEKYLLQKIGNSYKYVSSLYPIAPNKYEMEHTGVFYYVVLSENTVLIETKKDTV